MTESVGRRAQLYAIFAVAFISLLAAYGLYYFSKDDGGWATTNNGAFVTPARTVQTLGWQIGGAPAVELDHWWIWQVSAGCDLQCESAHRNLRSVHMRLHKDAPRVRRGFTDVTGGGMLPRDTSADQAVSTIEIGRLTVDLGIYVVDPIGNLVFYYPPDTKPGLILDDLKRLLKVSQIG